MISILVADDHDIVRRGLRQLLEGEPGWKICGEAANGRDAVEKALDLKPHIVMLDISMPELNGMEATRRIRHALPKTEVLIYSMHGTEQLVREVVSAGARGYVMKSDPAEHLISAVEALAHHRPFFTTAPSEAILNGFLGSIPVHAGMHVPSNTLSSRELEIVQLLAEGKSNKGIAALLNISVKTVETHRAAIMRKLGAESIAELVRYAIRNKLIDP